MIWNENCIRSVNLNINIYNYTHYNGFINSNIQFFPTKEERRTLNQNGQKNCLSSGQDPHIAFLLTPRPLFVVPAIPAKELDMSNPVWPLSCAFIPDHKCMKNLRGTDQLIQSTFRTMRDVNCCCKPLSFGIVCYITIEN